jgi:hypothetical protein
VCIFLLRGEHGRMVPLQYVYDEELVSLFRRC